MTKTNSNNWHNLCLPRAAPQQDDISVEDIWEIDEIRQ